MTLSVNAKKIKYFWSCVPAIFYIAVVYNYIKFIISGPNCNWSILTSAKKAPCDNVIYFSKNLGDNLYLDNDTEIM